MKVWVYTHDPVLHLAYSEAEAELMFGPLDSDDEEYFTDIPEEVYAKMKKAKSDLFEASEQIKKYWDKERNK
ncbi:MAG: hypothetical protein K9M94_13005 [Spirochaetia bacterium]|nr:hypothetical protein [Spirochaetia bacterium]